MTTAVAERPRGKAGKPAGEDPVTSYARRVLSGEIVAARAVRLACQRHFDDLAREKTDVFPYEFDRKSAQHVIDFFPQFLTLESGERFVLPEWLQFCYGTVFGWKCSSGPRKGKRRFIYGFFETSKGSGKTPSAGGIGLYGMTFDDEPYAEILSAGFDHDQASIMLNDAIRMANANDEYRFDEGLEVGKYNIANTKNGSWFRAASAEHRGKSGPRTHMVLGDEIHEHRDGRVIIRLIAGFKHRTQPLALLYTNSGSDRTSICWEYHQKSISVLDGTQPDEQWFAYVCHLDACEACYAEGYRQPKDGCQNCDDWTDPAVWPKVAPALGVVIQEKYLQDAVDMALSIPSEYSERRRLNFCIWTETHTVWIPPERWDACKVPAVSTDNAKGLACAAGLDPSSTLDLTAFVIAVRHDDPPTKHAETVTIEGQDEHGQQITLAYTLNFHVELIPFFWIPEQTLLERVRTERIPYDVWKRADKLKATPGPAIDHNAIYDFVLAQWKTFKIQKLGMDENGGRYLFMKLQNEGRLGKDQVVSVGQGFKLSEAFKFIEILVAHRRLRHDGHPVLAWNFANAEPDRHRRTGALAINKPSETKRIDGAIATAMAVAQLMTLPQQRHEPQMFFLRGKK